MKFGAVIMIAFTVFCALFLCFGVSLGYINNRFPELLGDIKSDLGGVSSPALETEAEIKVEKSDQSSKIGESSIAVNAGAAKGKIVEKFLNPYTAKYSYGKIYLKNNTSEKLDIEGLYKQKLKFKIAKNTEPQVLIVHTHTTESYMLNNNDFYTDDDDTRTRDPSKNVVAMGDIFEKKLRAAGIAVIHDTTIHDDPAYSGSYDRAKETIMKDLKAYPSIKVILDVHRDSISGSGSDKIKPIAVINGKKYAQVMLVMGSETGDIKNFPNWKQNLSLALKYQQTMEVMYPGLARAITFNSAKYNENISSGSLLIEMGSEANTLEEATLSANAAADALVSLLNTLQ